MPVPKREWMPSSQFIPKDQFGNDVVRVKFILKARLNDGYVKWQGTFNDRDDLDAFLYALLKGSLIYEKELWKLPNNEWSPDVGTELTYQFLTDYSLTATTQSTFSRPTDWNNAINEINCIGAGGSGGVASRTTAVACSGAGGGGGGYGLFSNLTLSGNATYICGTGGTAVVRSTAGATAGNAGTATWFGQGATSYATASVGGNGGGGGGATNTVSATGGAGGTGKGTGNDPGGRGGNISMTAGTTVRVGTGGGGGSGYAGSSYTADGIDATGSAATTTDGGNGSAPTADGGIAPGGAGDNSPGAIYGGGGGAGNIGTTSPANGGPGGTYGGGGGGVGIGTSTGTTATGTSGAGAQGSIYLYYIPASDFASFFNSPMLGM